MPAMLILAGVQLAMSLYGSYKSGKAATAAGTAAERAARAQADLMDANASIIDLQAQDAVERGALAESGQRTQTRGIIGAQRAGFGADNIDVGYGSAVDVQADAAYLGELDAQAIRTNALREAWGFKVDAQDMRERATITRREGVVAAATGRERATAAYVAGAGSLIGGASDLLKMKYGFDRDRRAS